MRFLSLALATLMGLTDAVWADRFAEYSVPLSQELLVLPDFDSAQREFRLFRTRIRDGIEREGINFAGHWSVIYIPCGTNCTYGYAVNLSEGSIINAPVSGEIFFNKRLYYQPASNLFVATWTEGGGLEGPCMIAEWLLEDNAFRTLSIVKHPSYVDCLP